MAITRVTQNMLTQRSLTAVEGGLLRMSQAQEQLSTGKRINRPSDDPTGTTTAMRAQAGIADQQQYQRNASDGLGWLSTIDATLSGMNSEVQRAYTLALQGSNTGSNSPTSLDAMADEVDQIRASMLDAANTTYLGRPVFGGTTAGSVAFDPDGTYAGDDGQVLRRVGDATVVRVDTDGRAALGPDGDNVLDHLAALSAALRSGDGTAVSGLVGTLQSDLTRVSAAMAKEGAAYNQISGASDSAGATTLALQKTQSDVADVDIAEATINVATQQTAYQAALAATSKTMQPSLLDFLR